MVKALIEDREFAEELVTFIDVMREFYQHLGIGGERTPDKTETVFLRFKHTLIMQRARGWSKMIGDVPAFEDEGERGCRALFDRIIRDLEAEPLSVT